MIRHAEMKDWDEILSIYARARNFMCQTGNPNQWRDKDPARDLLIQNIRMKQLYLLEDSAAIQAVFALIPGTDPTYSYIEGAWMNDLPYAAIHRVASAGRRTGVLKECLAFCQKE